jgi:hypothetical protein
VPELPESLRAKAILADKAYDSDKIIQSAQAQAFHDQPSQKADHALYKTQPSSANAGHCVAAVPIHPHDLVTEFTFQALRCII